MTQPHPTEPISTGPAARPDTAQFLVPTGRPSGSGAIPVSRRSRRRLGASWPSRPGGSSATPTPAAAAPGSPRCEASRLMEPATPRPTMVSVDAPRGEDGSRGEDSRAGAAARSWRAFDVAAEMVPPNRGRDQRCRLQPRVPRWAGERPDPQAGRRRWRVVAERAPSGARSWSASGPPPCRSDPRATGTRGGAPQGDRAARRRRVLADQRAGGAGALLHRPRGE